jgi:hypothetical protein
MPAYWSNLRSLVFDLYLSPYKDLKLRLFYQKMWAIRAPYFPLTAEQMAIDHEVALLRFFLGQ